MRSLGCKPGLCSDYVISFKNVNENISLFLNVNSLFVYVLFYTVIGRNDLLTGYLL